MLNHCVILASRPTGIAQSENFAIESRSVPPIGEGQILIRNAYLSVDPAMRGWIADVGNYAAPVATGAVMRSLATGIIVESRHPDWRAGAPVTGWFGWQEFALVEADAILRGIAEIDLGLSAPLGILGINGVTAYLALTRIGQPKPGETVLVSTAAGAVGSVVGQVARKLGCHTVGITGSGEKVRLCLDDYGYNEAIDYHEADLSAAIAAACPSGIDVYFDNTAGAISDAALPHLALFSRIVVCGTAALPSWSPWPQGLRVERHLLVKRARMEGFVVFDHLDSWDTTVAILADWLRAGSIRHHEDILMGLESAPDALAGLYRGENVGKRVICLWQP